MWPLSKGAPEGGPKEVKKMRIWEWLWKIWRRLAGWAGTPPARDGGAAYVEVEPVEPDWLNP